MSRNFDTDYGLGIDYPIIILPTEKADDMIKLNLNINIERLQLWLKNYLFKIIDPVKVK